MTAKHKDKEAIFDTAIQLEDVVDRRSYLDKACGDDKELRADIESLIRAHETESPLDAEIFGSSFAIDDSPLAEGPGTVIDKYKLLEQIGEGGMAVVYMAEQEKPIRRKVALKIIKLGMDTKSVIARFEAERQALAMMDHPNIAKVLDAGATETGRPYFVMELVTGVSITEYCDKNNLNTKQRLVLFIQVCNAVQHAHQKGIIHRDIKPSNVMVAHHDGRPVPKVIDFGIAKATNQRLTEKTLFTRYAHIIGTPAYMSPEQADITDLDIDTRSDIYSLGVLLYELLTGTTPFSEQELRKAGYLEMQRVIREEEPAKPSTKLTTLGETLTDIAKCRDSTPDLLTKIIRGDLDWIVMKSLEKDRTDRYDTVSALAVDVRRHLENEPIFARAPKITYRLQKFLRRHRSQAIAAGAIALLAGTLIPVLSVLIDKHTEVKSLKHQIILSHAREYFHTDKDLTAALAALEPILNSEHVGPEAKSLCAEIYLFRAAYYERIGEKDNLIADMERYVDVLVPSQAEGQRNSQVKDLLIGLCQGTAVNLGQRINSTTDDVEPSISDDGLELYFASYRPGGHGDGDIWVAKRVTTDAEWEEPTNLGHLVNSSAYDGGTCLSPDGLSLYFTTARGDGAVMVTRRESRSESWGTPEIVYRLEEWGVRGFPSLSSDNLQMYVCEYYVFDPDGFGLSDLWVSTRSSVNDAWNAADNLGPIVNSPSHDRHPSISADGLALFFSSYRPGGYGDDSPPNDKQDIWVTTRTTKGDDWGTPVNLGPVVNTSVSDGGPSISTDGRTLYFYSRRPGGQGSYDLWQVSIDPVVDVNDDGKVVMPPTEDR